MGAVQGADGPNAEQIGFWNEVAGPLWVRHHRMLDSQIAHLGALALERLAPRPGERILDVGCGCGETTMAIARAVAPEGSAVGVDVSAPMLALARERAAREAVASAHFLLADAQTHDLGEGRFDGIFSRFGVMFFADPAAAFANLRRALAPRGRVSFVCWQGIERNPWMAIPMAALRSAVELPPPPPPDAPGPFALGESARLEEVLAKGGLREVRIEGVETELTLGGDAGPAAAIEFFLGMSLVRDAMERAGADARARAERALDAALSRHARGGAVRLSCGVWLATARA